MLKPVERELQTFRRVFELDREGLTLRAIAETLEGEGCRTKKCGGWPAESVRKVIRNRDL